MVRLLNLALSASENARTNALTLQTMEPEERDFKCASCSLLQMFDALSSCPFDRRIQGRRSEQAIAR